MAVRSLFVRLNTVADPRDELLDEIEGASISLHVEPADVLSEDSEEDQVEPPEH